MPDLAYLEGLVVLRLHIAFGPGTNLLNRRTRVFRRLLWTAVGQYHIV